MRIGPFVEWLILIGCPAQLEGNDADWSLCGMADYVSCLTETLILIGFSVEWLILIGCSVETIILIGPCLQERAFWDLHRPPPGQLSTTEMDIKVQWYNRTFLHSYIKVRWYKM